MKSSRSIDLKVILACFIVIAIISNIIPTYQFATEINETSLMISPPVVEITTGKGEVKSFNVQIVNNSQTVKDLAINTVDLKLNEGGDYIIDETSNCPISDWISTNSYIQILADEEKTITVTVNTPQNAKSGSYHCIIFFKNIKTEEQSSLNKDLKVPINTRVGSVLLLTVGSQVAYAGQINKINLPKFAFISEPVPGNVIIENRGNYYFYTKLLGSLENVWGKNKGTLTLPNNIVLPLTTRSASFDEFEFTRLGYHNVIIGLYLNGSLVSTASKGIMVLPSKRAIVLITVITILLIVIFQRLKKRIGKKLTGFGRLMGQNLNNRQQAILKIVRKEGFVTNRDIQEKLLISNKTAYLELRNMVVKNLLEEEGFGRNVRYILPQEKE